MHILFTIVSVFLLILLWACATHMPVNVDNKTIIFTLTSLEFCEPINYDKTNKL